MRRSLANPSTSDVFSQPRHTNPAAVLRLKWGKRGGSFFLKVWATFFSPSASILLPVSSPPKSFRSIRRCVGCRRLVLGAVGLFDAFGPPSCWEKQAIRCLARSQVGQRENLLVAELIAASHSSQMEHRNPRDPCCRAQEVPQWPVKISCFFTVLKAPPSLTPQDSAHDFFQQRKHTKWEQVSVGKTQNS